ncbi:MAG TPA: hypothetical protein VKR56_04075 [Candidatus Cybelea sp.]|nr:hypothetical protein [Candidatus Cybelea sp.]
MKKLIFGALLAGAMSTVPILAEPKCGTGRPISYDDVEAVMLKSGYQDWPGPQEKWQTWKKANAFQYSAFYVLFWQPFPTKYIQYNLEGAIGTYTLGATIASARGVLKRDSFFSISNRYADEVVTDTPMSVVTVLRCSVVTRIMVYVEPRFQEPAIQKLLADLRALIINSSKTRISKSPQDFEETLLFDY